MEGPLPAQTVEQTALSDPGRTVCDMSRTLDLTGSSQDWLFYLQK